jgi:hypothetical protein
MRAGRTFPQWLSLCAVALVLVQLGGMAHLAAALHGICWEHGVLVEFDAAQAGVSAAPAPEGLSRTAGPLIRSDRHFHCTAVWTLRQAKLKSSGFAQVIGCRDHLVSVLVGNDGPRPDGWALDRAPKQSPPV